MSRIVPDFICSRYSDEEIDRKELAHFRSNPPAFLLVSAKRKTK